MKAIQIVLDDATAERFEAFAEQFNASNAQVAAGLVRAALRWALRPEVSPIGKGRPMPTLAGTLIRILVKKPQTLKALLDSFPEEQHEELKEALGELGPRVAARPDGVLEITARFFPTLTEKMEEQVANGAFREAQEKQIVNSRMENRKRLNEQLRKAFGNGAPVV